MQPQRRRASRASARLSGAPQPPLVAVKPEPVEYEETGGFWVNLSAAWWRTFRLHVEAMTAAACCRAHPLSTGSVHSDAMMNIAMTCHMPAGTAAAARPPPRRASRRSARTSAAGAAAAQEAPASAQQQRRQSTQSALEDSDVEMPREAGALARHSV